MIPDMKSLFLSVLLILGSLGSMVGLTSCASNSGGAGDGTYTAPPALSSVDATDRMRSQYRQEFR